MNQLLTMIINVYRGAITRPRELWRWSFILGMLVASRAAANLHPSVFIAPTPAFTVGQSPVELTPSFSTFSSPRTPSNMCVCTRSARASFLAIEHVAAPVHKLIQRNLAAHSMRLTDVYLTCIWRSFYTSKVVLCTVINNVASLQRCFGGRGLCSFFSKWRQSAKSSLAQPDLKGPGHENYKTVRALDSTFKGLRV
jgi:hypothetical protein